MSTDALTMANSADMLKLADVAAKLNVSTRTVRRAESDR